MPEEAGAAPGAPDKPRGGAERAGAPLRGGEVGETPGRTPRQTGEAPAGGTPRPALPLPARPGTPASRPLGYGPGRVFGQGGLGIRKAPGSGGALAVGLPSRGSRAAWPRCPRAHATLPPRSAAHRWLALEKKLASRRSGARAVRGGGSLTRRCLWGRGGGGGACGSSHQARPASAPAHCSPFLPVQTHTEELLGRSGPEKAAQLPLLPELVSTEEFLAGPRVFHLLNLG